MKVKSLDPKVTSCAGHAQGSKTFGSLHSNATKQVRGQIILLVSQNWSSSLPQRLPNVQITMQRSNSCLLWMVHCAEALSTAALQMAGSLASGLPDQVSQLNALSLGQRDMLLPPALPLL